MKRFLILVLFACIFCGCATVNYLSADWSNDEQREAQDRKHREWKIKNYELQYQSGQIDRAAYNRARRSHGLAPIE